MAQTSASTLSLFVTGITVLSGAYATIPIVVNTWPWPQATDAGDSDAFHMLNITSRDTPPSGQ